MSTLSLSIDLTSKNYCAKMLGDQRRAGRRQNLKEKQCIKRSSAFNKSQVLIAMTDK